MKSQQIELILTEAQVQTVINTTKTLQIIMKSIQSVLNFAVLTKVVIQFKDKIFRLTIVQKSGRCCFRKI
jgi:hypothetical protein